MARVSSPGPMEQLTKESSLQMKLLAQESTSGQMVLPTKARSATGSDMELESTLTTPRESNTWAPGLME